MLKLPNGDWVNPLMVCGINVVEGVFGDQRGKYNVNVHTPKGETTVVCNSKPEAELMRDDIAFKLKLALREIYGG